MARADHDRGADHRGKGVGLRLTWAQPEDLVPAELVALREQGADPIDWSLP